LKQKAIISPITKSHLIIIIFRNFDNIAGDDEDTTEILNFRDRANFEHIRENLFKSTEYGRVAVMIGAGFSRNADKFSPQIPNFPLSWDLGKKFYSKLHPEYDISKDEEEIDFGQNFDTYASEYSKKFGKGELHSLLIKLIPDEKYLPGEIHKLLLSLPWSDVFTTNYDTLLERTLPKIYDKKYDIIRTTTQIPLKSKPRIVKLHGDILSNSFIITEEDYNGYKKKYGAFQNLVQESILENVFCLIGFGGTDKNFTRWKEWVASNLGEHSPPIYLCGVLDYDEEKRAQFESQNIKIVDLGPLFPKEKFIDRNTRHKIAIEWFLKSLAVGKPNNKLNWPDLTRQEVIPIKNPLAPPLCSLPPQQLFEDIKYVHLDSNKTTIKQDIEKYCENWKIERDFYPGWILAPKNSRTVIWENTKYAIKPILDNINNFEFPTNLNLLFELSWRLEICLTPLFSNVADTYEYELKKINPFPDLITISESVISPQKEEYQANNWDLISRQWIDLAYSLVRHYRESNHLEKYRFWIDVLEKIITIDLNWKNRWYYEKCMFALFQLNQEDLRRQLDAWLIEDDHPEYQIKKASLLSELGELEKAKSIAEHALKTIRLHIHSNRDDFYLLSLEGWCLHLLQSIERNRFIRRNKNRDYSERWEQLSKYYCDPRIELEKFSASVSIPKPKKQPEHERKQGFDPGVITQTHRIGFEPEIVHDLPAFAFLKMTENVGAPLVCGSVRFNKEIPFAADWIEKYDPLWAMCILSRSIDDEIVDHKFHRLAILRLDDKIFDEIYSLAMNSLKQSLSDYHRNGHNNDFDNSLSYRQISIQMELLSRLSIRLNDNRLAELLDLAINIYKSQKIAPKIGYYDRIGTLFKRVSHTISQNKLLEKIGELIDLPIPTANYFTVPFSDRLPEPFEYIEFSADFKIPASYNRNSWGNSISNLIQISRTGLPDERRRSLLRLIRLFKINGLTIPEIEEFKSALYHKVDPASQLPIDTGCFNYVLLGLPELNHGDVKNKYRCWLLSQPLPSSITRERQADGKMRTSMKGGGEPLTRLIYEWVYSSTRLQLGDGANNENTIDWSESEILTLFFKINEIWEEQKLWLSEFKEKKDYFYPYLLDQFKEILFLFEQIVLLKLDKITNKDEVERILKTFVEFSKYEICINSALPGILLVTPTESDKIVDQLRFGLFSSNPEISERSIDGFYNYTILAYHKKIPSIDERIISDFVYSIILRKEPGLSHALYIASDLIKNYPTLFKEQHINDLLRLLETLITPQQRAEHKSDSVVQEDIVRISDIEYEAIQRNAIELRKSLQEYLIKEGKPIPEFLKKGIVVSSIH